MDLRSRLDEALTGPVCIVGMGNVDLGDDAFGVRLAEALRDAGHPHVVEAATAPELWVGRIARGGFRSVLFLDAVDFPGDPGSAILLDAVDVKSRFPQISTHRLSIGTLASVIESHSEARVWLLGAKPLSLRPGRELSHALARTLDALKDLLVDALGVAAGAGGVLTPP